MKERSKEKMAELLMEELLSELADNTSIKKMLGEMVGLPIAPLMQNLVREFERVVETFHQESLERVASERSRTGGAHSEPFTPDDTPSIPLSVDRREDSESEPNPAVTPQDHTHEEPIDEKPVEVDGTLSAHPVASLPVDERDEIEEAPFAGSEQVEAGDSKNPGVEDRINDQKDEATSLFRKRLEEVAKRVEKEYLQKLEEEKVSRANQPSSEPVAPTKEPEKQEIAAQEETGPAVEDEAGEVSPQFSGRASRIPYRVTDKDCLYVHAVRRIPAEVAPAEEPFMLEEKGIDGREFAFAFDHGELRFFLSKINQNEMSVSRKGLLLLGKQESLQLRGTHEGILNELRGHGVVLPFEFGTVARGKDELHQLVERFHDEITGALDKLLATSWWTLSFYVQDARIAQLFGEPGSKQERVGRERERTSFAALPQQKKYDVKHLEKILQKEKKLAESVHEELTRKAERAEVQSMVGLGSGSSDEWKLILQAVYLVPQPFLQRFSRAVTDLQYRHILFEPMFALTGDHDAFSFQKK